MPSVKRFVAACILLGLPALVACRSSLSSNGYPRVLHYAHSPEQEELQDGSLRAKLMRKYLESQLHIPVELVSVIGYAPTIEAMHTGKVDIATFGPLGYILAAQKANAQAIATRGLPDGTMSGYRSEIVVPKNSPIHSIADLKAHTKDMVFMFTDPASTSGNLVPRAYLQSLGIDPEKDFKKTVFAGPQIAGVYTVKAGKVDAGAMSQTIVDHLVDLGKIAPDDLRPIWVSDLIPTSPYAVRGDLPEPLKKQIQQAYLDIPKKAPELWESIKKMSRVTDATMIPVNDSAYGGLRKFASQVKDFNIVEK